MQCQRSAAGTFENSKSKKEHNYMYVKIILRVICPTGMYSPFDSKQLV